MTQKVNIYYTKIDRAYFSNYQWEEQDLNNFVDSIRLDLKTLALLKDQIVVSVPHLLESEIVKDIILNNPEIISLGIVVPALNSDYQNVASFYNKKLHSPGSYLYSRQDTKEMQQLIDTSAPFIERWEENNASEWFVSRLLLDLKNTGSILRTNMMDVDEGKVNKIINHIEENQILDRGQIFPVTERIIGKPHEYFTDYVDFVYLLGGAISLDAEGFLPQDDLVRFDIASPDQARRRLSEMEVFYRLFLHVVRTHTLKTLPRNALEHLSYNDVAQLRKDCMHADFIKRYNYLQNHAKRNTIIHDPEKLVLTLSEIEELEWELIRLFSNSIAKEVKIKSHNEAMRKGLDLATSIASAVTFYGTIDSVVEVVNNGLSLMPESKLKSSIDRRIDIIWNKMKAIANSHQPASERSILLDFLGKVSKKYIEYLPDN
ncbi:MAG: hypothetical protein KKG02_10870 [Candidatus Edwardsbacteria bacterium]|nr:hypothetical protein [Candidatus Edwardsbacteria bacterium]